MQASKLFLSLLGAAALLTVRPSQAGGEFDREAAASALKSVSVQQCKRANGPTGDGHLVITFGSAGKVTLAMVDRPPFKDTQVGKCVQREFKKVKVPAFTGSVTVGKNFKID